MSLVFRNHIESIVKLADDEFSQVMKYVSRRFIRKHQFLIQEDSTVENDHFVIKGLFKASYINDKNKEHIVQFAAEDWWITDYQAYYKQAPATTNVVAIEDSEVLCLSLANREQLCADLQKIEHFFRIKISMGHASLQKRILSLLDKNARERYDQFLELYPSIVQRIPKTVLAAYLGVSRETLSRL